MNSDVGIASQIPDNPNNRGMIISKISNTTISRAAVIHVAIRMCPIDW